MVVCITVPSCNKVRITKQFRDTSQNALGKKTEWPKTNGVVQCARRPWYGYGAPTVQFSPHTERNRIFFSPVSQRLVNPTIRMEVSHVKKDKLRRIDLHPCRANPLRTGEGLNLRHLPNAMLSRQHTLRNHLRHFNDLPPDLRRQPIDELFHCGLLCALRGCQIDATSPLSFMS